MDFPSDLYYTKEHEWLRLGDDGTATVGITDFAQDQLGDIVYLEFPEEGDDFDIDEEFGSVEAVKTVSELFMPVSGTIAAVNEALNDNPEAVNEDPYGDGWLIKITLSDESQIDDLLSAQTYREMVGN